MSQNCQANEPTRPRWMDHRLRVEHLQCVKEMNIEDMEAALHSCVWDLECAANTYNDSLDTRRQLEQDKEDLSEQLGNIVCEKTKTLVCLVKSQKENAKLLDENRGLLNERSDLRKIVEMQKCEMLKLQGKTQSLIDQQAEVMQQSKQSENEREETMSSLLRYQKHVQDVHKAAEANTRVLSNRVKMLEDELQEKKCSVNELRTKVRNLAHQVRGCCPSRAVSPNSFLPDGQFLLSNAGSRPRTPARETSRPCSPSGGSCAGERSDAYQRDSRCRSAAAEEQGLFRTPSPGGSPRNQTTKSYEATQYVSRRQILQEFDETGRRSGPAECPSATPERLRPDDHTRSGCNRHPQLESCFSENENTVPRRYPQNDLSVMRTDYEGPNRQDKMVFGIRAFGPRSPSGCMEKCTPVTSGQKMFEDRSSPRGSGQSSMGECMEGRSSNAPESSIRREKLQDFPPPLSPQRSDPDGRRSCSPLPGCVQTAGGFSKQFTVSLKLASCSDKDSKEDGFGNCKGSSPDNDKNVSSLSTKCSPQSARGTRNDAQPKDKYQAKNVCSTARNTSKDTSKFRGCHRDLRTDKDRRKQCATQVKRPETPANTRRGQTEENSSSYQKFAQCENQPESGAGDKTVAVTLALEVDRDLDAMDCPLLASLALDGLKRALKEWVNPCNRTLSKECDTRCDQSDVRMCGGGDSSRDPCEGSSRNKERVARDTQEVGLFKKHQVREHSCGSFARIQEVRCSERIPTPDAARNTGRGPGRDTGVVQANVLRSSERALPPDAARDIGREPGKEFRGVRPDDLRYSGRDFSTDSGKPPGRACEKDRGKTMLPEEGKCSEKDEKREIQRRLDNIINTEPEDNTKRCKCGCTHASRTKSSIESQMQKTCSGNNRALLGRPQLTMSRSDSNLTYSNSNLMNLGNIRVGRVQLEETQILPVAKFPQTISRGPDVQLADKGGMQKCAQLNGVPAGMEEPEHRSSIFYPGGKTQKRVRIDVGVRPEDLILRSKPDEQRRVRRNFRT